MGGIGSDTFHKLIVVITTGTWCSDDGTKERTWSFQNNAADRCCSAIEARCRQHEP